MLRVLIIDDDFGTLGVFKSLLRGRCDVKTVSDGETAMRSAFDLHPDVVFVDLLLSYENGLDLLELLRPALPRAHLALMTGHPGDEIISEAFASGADSFVGKEELATAVIHLLDDLEKELAGETGQKQ